MPSYLIVKKPSASMPPFTHRPTSLSLWQKALKESPGLATCISSVLTPFSLAFNFTVPVKLALSKSPKISTLPNPAVRLLI